MYTFGSNAVFEIKQSDWSDQHCTSTLYTPQSLVVGKKEINFLVTDTHPSSYHHCMVTVV